MTGQVMNSKKLVFILPMLISPHYSPLESG